ncbi:MAG: hypothetical protein JWO38_7476 [Gemmataceae bacterium]|nr:hypothetical protein [Gemmataceae bacterium]
MVITTPIGVTIDLAYVVGIDYGTNLLGDEDGVTLTIELVEGRWIALLPISVGEAEDIMRQYHMAPGQ